VKLYSPAKLNLFFRVLRKRADGFHEIASLMQAISLYDRIEFSFADEDSLTCTDPQIPTDENNFIHKARSLFRQKTGFSAPLAIHIDKQIPPEGGLGGGSGNIATTLYALNKLSEAGLEEEELATWAGEISSDAPFFFSNGTAYATGRGEIVKRLDPLRKTSFYLAKPEGEGLSTPLVYKHCTPNACVESPEDLLRGGLRGELKACNDLEYPAFALRPDLLEYKRRLLALGFDTVSMTGSGTAFFCLGEVKDPEIPGVQFWKSTFISRKTDRWYEI
jgi:4-diphosphocytidyl-2-C-methyl-D-erythritol kinase